jgi:glucose-1-phosphate cytidylyltransferase
MNIYSHYGFNEFIICLGYKGYIVKEYFANYFLHQSDVTIDLSNNQMQIHKSATENWKITLVDTGKDSLTGGRVKRIQPFVNNERFCLTYGDGVGNIELDKLLSFHLKNNKLCTVTSVQPTGRFGVMNINEDQQVESFFEKRQEDTGWINAGFFICEPGVFDYISGDSTIWEREPLENLSKDKQLMAFKHKGFWKPMDNLKDKMDLNELWSTGKAEWKIWK